MKARILLSVVLLLVVMLLHTTRLYSQCSVTIDPVAPICQGQSATLTAVGTGGTLPYTYRWSNNSTLGSITVSSAGTYTVTLTDAASTPCTSTAQRSVVVNQLPIPIVSGFECVCINQSGVVYTTPLHTGSSYTWTLTGHSSFIQNNNQVTVVWGNSAGAGTVSVLETASNGCTKTDLLPIMISNSFPSTTFSIVNNNVCSGTAVNFTGPAGANLSYLWNFGDPVSGSNNTSTLKNPIHVFNSYGCGNSTYNVTLTVTTSCGCQSTSSSQVATIKKQPTPRLIDPDFISPFSNCDNNPTPSNSTFELTVNNATPNTSCITGYTINWGDGSGTVSFPAGFATTSHTYTQLGAFNLVITATTSNGCTHDTTYVVANQSNPAVGISAPGTTTGCFPVTWNFTISGAGNNSPGTIYRIEFGDGTTLVKTNDQLLIDSVIAHTYTSSSCGQGLSGNMFIVKVTAINACDSTWANVSNVRVFKPPVASFVPNPDSTGCLTDQECFINTSQSGFGTNCNTVTTYLWDFGDPSSGANNTSTALNPCHTYSGTGNFVVSLTASNNQCPSASTFTHSVCIDPSPNSSFTVDKTTDCVPFTVVATNTSTTPNTCGDRIYTWSVVKSGSPQCTPSTQNYTLTPSGDNATIVFQDPGEYLIRLNVKNACSPTGVNFTVPIIAKSVPRITLANVPDMCQNGTVVPSATFQSCYDPISEYLWTFTGGTPSTSTVNPPLPVAYNTPGTYSIKVKAKNACLWSSEVTSNTFLVKPLPTANAGLPQTICKGGNITLNGQVGGSATGGTWSSNAGGAFTPNANTLAATWTPPASYSGSATLTLTTTGMSPCSAATSTVAINVLPTPTATAGTNQTICQGSSVTLAGNVGGSATGGIWSTPAGGTFTPNANALNATWTPLAAFHGTAVLTLTTTGMTPCAAVTSTMSVIVKETPTASAGSAPTICQLGAVSLNGSVGGSATGGTWSTPDGGTFSPNANTLTATWTPPAGFTGTATLTLTTTGMSPCTAATSVLNVIISPTPSANAGTAQTICQGGSVTLSGTVGGSATGGSWSSTAGGTFSPSASDLNATWTPPASYSGSATVTLTTTGMAPCPAANSNVIITVRPTPTINAGTPQSICQGSSVLLAGTAGGAATGGIWSTADGGSFTPSASSLNATWTPPAGFSGISILTLTSTGMAPCPVVTSTVSITVKPTPTVAAGTAQTICQGGNLSLAGFVGGSATGGTWTSPVGGTFSPGATTLNAIWTPPSTFSGNAVLTLTTTGMAPCSAVSSNVTITVRPTPTANAGISQTICQGGSVILNGSVGGSASGGMWSNPAGGTFSPNATTLNATWTPPGSFSGSATLTLTTTGMEPCVAASSNVTITVNPGQMINVQPQPLQSICTGVSLPLPLLVGFSGGTGSPSYQWFSNTAAINSGGTPITGATNSSYMPPVYNTAGTYHYYVVVTLSGAGCGNTTSNVATVEVFPDPVMTNQPEASQTVCQNATPAILSVSVSGGTGSASYQWYSNVIPNTSSGTIISGATNSSYEPSTVSVGTTYYYCIINQSGPGCSVTSNIAAVIVNLGPSFTTQPAGSTVCVGGTPAMLNIAYTNGAGSPSYQWYSNTLNQVSGGVSVSGATNSSYQPSGGTAGTTYYYCTLTFSTGGCTSITSQVVPVVVAPDPTINTQPLADQTVCVGGTLPAPLTVTYTGGTGSVSYQWFANTNPSTTGGTSINGATNSSYLPPAFTVPGTNYFYVVVSMNGNGCGSATSNSSSVTILPDPVVTAEPLSSQTICQNSTPGTLTVAINGGTGSAGYQWYSNVINNTTSGTIISGATNSSYEPSTVSVGTTYYYCIINQSGPGCSVISQTAAVIVNLGPSFTTQPAGSTVCVGGTPAMLNIAYTNGAGIPSYQWYSNPLNQVNGGTPISGATNASYQPSGDTEGTTYYYCIISFTTGGCSSITSQIVPVVVTSDPSISTQPTSEQTICVGGNLSGALTVGYSGGTGTVSYQWYSNTTPGTTGGTTINGATNASYAPPTYTIPNTYYYYVVVAMTGNGCGTATSNLATVHVLQDPVVTEQPLDNQVICQNASPTVLSVLTTGGNGSVTYQWYSNAANNTITGSPISAATNSTYTPPSALVGTTFYYCVVNQSGPGCSVTSETAEVVINPGPSFTTQPSGSTVCVGGMPSLLNVAYINGAGNPTYQWFSNSSPSTTGATAIAGATNSSYQPSGDIEGTTHYYCVVSLPSGGCTSITSEFAQVVVVPDPAITSQPQPNQSLCVGGTIPLPLAMNFTGGTGTPSYQWYVNSQPSTVGSTAIPGATNTSYLPPAFGSIGTYYYYAVVELSGNGCGSTTTNFAAVEVLPDPVITEQPLPTQTICQNAIPAQLVIATSGGTGTVAYQWYSNVTNNNITGSAINGATNSSYTPPSGSTGTMYYYCLVNQTGPGCSVPSATSEVIVNVGPSFTMQPAGSTLCAGGTPGLLQVAYTNGAGSPTYQWYSNTSNSTSGATEINGATNASYQPSGTTAGTLYYYCVISLASGGCSNITSAIAQIEIMNDPAIATQPAASQTLCIGGNLPQPLAITVSGGTGSVSYQWFSNTSPSTSGGTIISGATNSIYMPETYTFADLYYYYAVVSMSGNGCGDASSNIALVEVLPDPVVTTQPMMSQTICQDAIPSTLTIVTSGGTGSPGYQWYSNAVNSNSGGTLIGTATSASFVPPTSMVGTTYYYCIMTQSGPGCSVTSETAEVIVNAGASITQHPVGSIVCEGGIPGLLSVEFTNGVGSPTYQWFSNTVNNNTSGIPILLATNPTYQPQGTVVGTTYYYCVLTLASGGCGTIASNTAEVIVKPIPEITSPPTDSICNRNLFEYTIQSDVSNSTFGWHRNVVPGISNLAGDGNAPLISETLINTTSSDIDVTYKIWASGPGIPVCHSDTFLLVVTVKDFSVNAGTDLTINFGTRDTLAGVVTGGGGNLAFTWEPADSILSFVSPLEPITKNLYGSPVTYTLTATDMSMAGCTLSDDMDVILVGSAVSVAPTITPKPVCPEGTAQLFANPSGGNGTYTFTWTSSTDPVWTSPLENPFVIPGVLTTYHVTVFDGFNTAMGSVIATIKPPPVVYNITGGGKYCAGGEGMPIGLDNSSSTDMYYLIRMPDDTVATVNGQNGVLTFGVYSIPGTYRASARSISLPQCASEMNGTVTITIIQLPQEFVVTGGGSYPAGGSGITVGLSDSEVGIEYELVFNHITPILPRKNGTGFPLDFGNQFDAGVYTITAYTKTNPVCESEMDDSAIVIVNPYPSAYNVTGGGEVCFGDSGVFIGLDGSEIGVQYQVRHNGNNTGVPEPGTGDSLFFGPYNLAGIYTIEGMTVATGLTTMMTGSATIIVNPLPLPYLMVPQGDTCYGSELLLNGSQSGVNYYLMKGNDTVVKVPGTGQFALLSFGAVYDTGTYRAIAINAVTGCKQNMIGTVTLKPLPDVFMVLPPGILCPGQEIILAGSQTGISYQLRRDLNINVGTPVSGTGDTLNFGPHYLSGEYSVLAYNPVTHCYAWMDSTATILPSPTVYHILPSGDTCSPALVRLNGSQTGMRYRLIRNGNEILDTLDGSGQPLSFGYYSTPGIYQVKATDLFSHCEYWMADSLHILAAPIAYSINPNGPVCVGSEVGLDDSETGVNYTLYRDNWVFAGGPVAGTGNPLSFGIQTIAGSYTARGTITGSGCNAMMPGTAVLEPQPQVYQVQPPGIHCAGTDIFINNSQVSTVYYLIRNDTIQVAMKTGNGGAIHFGLQYIEGTYTVKAVDVLFACEAFMQGEVVIHPVPLKFGIVPAGITCPIATIGLLDSEPGIVYQLRRDSLLNAGPPVTGDGLPVTFGPQSVPGTYSVYAYNPADSCSEWMTGRLILRPNPMIFNILPSGDTCAPAEVRLNGSQPGIRYELRLDGLLLPGFITGTGSSITFGSQQTPGTYKIIATDTVTDCFSVMADSVRIFSSPVAYQIYPADTACINDVVGITDSETGVDYVLIRDNSVVVAGPVPGTGFPLSFGPQPFAGVYTIEGQSLAMNCRTWMTGSAVLAPAPVAYSIQPQGERCGGTNLYLSGSQVNVTYRLLRNGLIEMTVPGTGTMLPFGPQFLAGVYTVEAVNTGSMCDTLMMGSTTILPLPAPYPITPQGAICAPSDVGLEDSEPGINYQLYRNGFATGLPVTGTGSAISFGMQPEGSYLVIAENTLTGCADTMPNPIVITPGPLAMAGNDTAVCAGHSLLLQGHASDYSSVEWLSSGDGIFSNLHILNPIYTPGEGDTIAGQVALVFKVYGSPACLYVAQTDTLILTIDAFPLADAGVDDTICITQNAILSGAATHYSSVYWSGSGDGMFDNPYALNPTYQPGAQDKLVGQVQLSFAVVGSQACDADTASDVKWLYLMPLPVANAGIDDTLCENHTYRLTGLPQNHSTVQWTTMGDGTFDNQAIADPVYTPGNADRMVGSVRLVFTVAGKASCSSELARDTIRLVLNKLPLVDVGPDTTLCANLTYGLDAQVQRYSTLEWITSGDGVFSDIAIQNPVYTPGGTDILNGSVLLKLTAGGLQECAGETVADSLVLSLHPLPVADAGMDTVSCPNIPVPVHGSAQLYMSVLWTTTGDGIFDNAGLLQPDYSPGPQDIALGYTDLIMTVNGIEQCAAIIDSDTVRVHYKPLPTVVLSGSTVICEGSTGSLVCAFTGMAPFSVTYTDGLNQFTVVNIPSSPYTININPVSTTTYTVLQIGDGNCTVTATGPAYTVNVHPLPEVYPMVATNGGMYCEGGTGVEIGIDNSQSGFFYQLMMGGQAQGFAMPGTGQPLSFGWITVPGIYKVKAYHPQTFCEVEYPDSVVVLMNPLPRVDFYADSTCFGQETHFHLTGLDIGKIATWEWTFGDGSSASFTAPVEPQHLYGVTGIYQVVLEVTDTNGCQKILLHTLQVFELPVAHFSHSAPACSGYTVSFTDYSYCPDTSYLLQWHWDFGDGTDTLIHWPSLPDVAHSYSLPNTYAVTLSVVNSRGCTAEKVRTVSISPSPAANFDYSNPCEKEVVQFSDISQLNGGGSIVEWNWNFGDPVSGVNNTSIQQSPVHVYNAPGNYTVRLIAMNTGGCIDTMAKVVVVKAGPRANFTFNEACYGTLTQFEDASVPNGSAVIEWDWDFGDGSPHSVAQNPAHLYANPGTYMVHLVVKNDSFCTHDTTIAVTAIPLPVADFQTNSPVCLGSAVSYTNISTTLHGQIVKWVWDFGDGSTPVTINFPANPNVSHVFSGTALQHTVRLTVKTNDSCTAFKERLVISVPGPLANFTHSGNFCPGENVQFADMSQSGGAPPVSTWNWNFGDPLSGSMNTSSLQDPVHQFSGSGDFNVLLVAGNGSECVDSVIKVVTISPGPVAAFDYTAVCQGQVTHFTDVSTANAPSIIAWDWDFGDNTPHATVPDPDHLYLTPGTFVVTLTVTNSLMCSHTISDTIHVIPNPVAAFGHSTDNCAGSEVVFNDLSATPQGYIVRWMRDFGDGSTTSVTFPGVQNVFHTYAAGGSYTVMLTVKTSDSCTNTSQHVVTVYDAPLANFSNAAGGCEGSPVQFTDLSQPNGGGTIIGWTWDFGDPGSGAANQSSQQHPMHIFSTSGTFDVRLIIDNIHQCADTIVKQVTVNEKPLARCLADTACFGFPTHFTDTSTTASGTIIAWSWNFGDPSSGTYNTSTLQDPQHIYTAPGTYTATLQVTNSNQCVNDTLIQVSVKSSPDAGFEYEAACMQTPTQFTDLSVAPNSSLVVWNWDFGDGGTATIQNPTHIYSAAGTFTVKLTVTNLLGCSDSVSMPVTVHHKPLAAFNYSSFFCPARKVNFQDSSVAFGGSQVISHQWFFEPGYSSNIPNPSHYFSEADSTYLVTLIVTDDHGCSDTITDSVYVNPGFGVNISFNTACFGDSTQFTATSAAVGDSLYSPLWNFGDPASGQFNTSTSLTPSHLFTTTGEFLVRFRAWNADNCVDSVYRFVRVWKPPQPAYTFMTTPCDSVALFNDQSVAGDGSISEWQWEWADGSPPLVISSPGPADTIHIFSEEGDYPVRLMVTNSHGCIDSLTENVHITCITSAFAQIGVSVNCSNDSVVFYDQSEPAGRIDLWHWYFGDTTELQYNQFRSEVKHRYSPGTYPVRLEVITLVGTDTIRASHDTLITIRRAPVALFTADPVCFGDSTRFFDLADTSYVSINYRTWSFGDNSPVVLSDTLIDPVHKYMKAGTYLTRFTVSDTAGCRDSLTKMVTVHKLPVAGFSNTLPCSRYEISFSDNTVDGDTLLAGIWWHMGDPDNPYDTMTGPGVRYRYDSAGIYTVSMMTRDYFGCEDTTQVEVEVKSSPIAAFTLTDNMEGKQGKIQLNNASSPDALAFKWDFGNGKKSNQRDPIATYESDEHPYIIELVTWNENQCYDTTWMTYEFMFDNLFVPNAFVPDSYILEVRTFKPKGLNLQEYHIMVFDKWGHMLWESQKLDNDGRPLEGWDGTLEGDPLPQDVYLWKIVAKFRNGKVWEGSDNGNGIISNMGTVTLLR